jgi:hypothetical protein
MHLLMKGNFDVIKMHGTTIKIKKKTELCVSNRAIQSKRSSHLLTLQVTEDGFFAGL